MAKNRLLEHKRAGHTALASLYPGYTGTLTAVNLNFIYGSLKLRSFRRKTKLQQVAELVFFRVT